MPRTKRTETGIAKFLTDLFAASTNYKVTQEQRDETKDVYYGRFKDIKLTRLQWEKAFAALLKDYPNGDLPPLLQVSNALEAVRKQQLSDMGWCLFRLNGHQCSVRVKSVNGHWVQMQSKRIWHKDYPFGLTILTGSYHEMQLPTNAENVTFAPDQLAQVEDLEDHREDLQQLTAALANRDD